MVKPHGRIDARDDRESDGFGNEGKGDDGPRQQVPAWVGEPLLARGCDDGQRILYETPEAFALNGVISRRIGGR